MSLNLIFTINNKAVIDFPFQTTTSLTKKVLEESDKEKQLEIIKNELKSWNWDDKDIEDTIRDVKDLLYDPDLKLTLI